MSAILCLFSFVGWVVAVVEEEADEDGGQSQAKDATGRVQRGPPQARNYLINSTQQFRKRGPVTCAYHA